MTVPPIVELTEAHLCQDCDAIAAAPQDCCVRCGSRALLSLSTVLNREAAATKVPNEPLFYESRKQRMDRLSRALWVEGML